MTDSRTSVRSRQGRRGSWATPRTVASGLGLAGVAAGLWLVTGVPGVVATVAVAAVLYALSGVYAFGVGQFVLAATFPARITPELVLVELGLSLVLVSEGVIPRGVGRVALGTAALRLGVGTAALALVAIGVGTSASGRERDVVLLAGAGFVLVTGALWLSTRTVETDAQEGPATDAPEPHADRSGW